jgi:ribonuclease P protein component
LTWQRLRTIGALNNGRFGGHFSFEFEGMSDEAHFPAEQSGPQAAARVPPSQRDGRRAQDPERSPRPRPQEAQRLVTITKRSDFLAANRGKRAPMPGFILLVRPRDDGDSTMRVGFTVTKKIGNAVVRNRMKRRFRALARETLPELGIVGADHVLIGRAGGIERDYSSLASELKRALKKLAAG